MNKKFPSPNIPFAFLALLIAATQVVQAQSSVELAFDSTTIGYARVDLQEIDIPETIGMLAKLVGEQSSIASQLKSAQPMIQQFADSLREAGATEAFAIVSLTDVFEPRPCLFVGWSDAESRDDVAAVLNPVLSLAGMTHHFVDTGMLIGNPRLIQRLTNNPLPLRDDVSGVFSVHAGSDLTVVYAPSADQRKAIRDVYSRLPAPFDAFSGPLIADGGSIVAMRVNAGDDRKMEFVVRGIDAASNQNLANVTDELMQRIAGNEFDLSIKGLLPRGIDGNPNDVAEELKLADLCGQMTLERAKDRFTISFNQSDQSFDRLCNTVGEGIALIESASRHTEDSNWLRQAVLACHNYHDAYKTLPPNAVYDEEGNALLSWRVMILPWIGERELYAKFRLDEPWDSEHNLKLLPQIPRIFVTEPLLKSEGKTTMVMPVGDQSIGRKSPLSLEEVKDGTSRTILIFNAAPESAVFWTQPVDWQFDAALPLRGLFQEGQTMLRAGFADGSIHMVERNEKRIRALLTTAGDEPIDQH